MRFADTFGLFVRVIATVVLAIVVVRVVALHL